MEDKFKIIHDIYYEPAGYGSVKILGLMQRKKILQLDYLMLNNGLIKIFLKNEQIKGYNSFVANYPYFEFQMDLFFINDGENQNIK
jgi:hypothetical protein